MEYLGYGTQLTVDIYQAAGHRLLDTKVMLELLDDLASEIETGDEGRLSAEYSDTDGSSAALLCSESQFYLHFFPDSLMAHFRVFTRRDVGLSPLMARFRSHLESSRFDGQISTVSKIARHDEQHVKRVLAGDRSYARARFEALKIGS